MFIVIISFPPIRTGKESDFLQWFTSSNQLFSGFKGFIRRRLLEPVKGGIYAAVVEFEAQAAFEEVHASPLHDVFGEKVTPCLSENPHRLSTR